MYGQARVSHPGPSPADVVSMRPYLPEETPWVAIWAYPHDARARVGDPACWGEDDYPEFGDLEMAEPGACLLGMRVPQR